MGYLLKEALKTLCGVNQWSYAVLWKNGYQNPTLLIWEECYFESTSYSRILGISGNEEPEIAFRDSCSSWESNRTSDFYSSVQAVDKVHLLVNRMMTNNHVNIVGEGLVGRVAFTGNYHWILSKNFNGEAHPPEVLKEVCQQFSAGMKTVAVIPVIPLGVVQFGSHLTITENTGFVNEVTALLTQLGEVPGLFLSGAYPSSSGLPVLGYSAPADHPSLESYMINTSSFLTDSLNHVGRSSVDTSVLENETSYSLAREIHNVSSNSSTGFSSAKQFLNGAVKAEVIPSNSSIWSTLDLPSSSSSSLNRSSTKSTEQSDRTRQGSSRIPDMTVGFPRSALRKNSEPSKCWDSNGLPDMEASFTNSVDHFTTNISGGCSSNSQQSELYMFSQEIEPFFSSCCAEDDIKHKFGGLVRSSNHAKYDDPCLQTQSGDDLIDILGVDLKNKLFSGVRSNCLSDKSSPNTHHTVRNQFPSNLAYSETLNSSQVSSESGIFATSSDHLLDAVVSNVHSTGKQSMDDSVSCRTSLTNTSSNSLRTGLQNEGSGIYGSQKSSWIEKGHDRKLNNDVSTLCSKKPADTSKTSRKRLKPGENPRPRPKDRQMIQDRVKELREMVPNGEKCSIDTLLERTIKHMLFMQSVTKHADKLKQTGTSKMNNEDGTSPLNGKFEGGATWAYEVGSNSMVCPIIVEDLNEPRHMLVKMLCEEGGLFLEIADMIRGLGLSILKGVMETLNDKTWARFAVEADRDVTRMEIFMSLVRLLEQNSKGTLPSLPVAGISCNFH